MTKTKKISYTFTIALVGLLYFVIFLLNQSGYLGRYELGIMNFICINIVLAVSLNITVGCLGQITLGHAGFMSVGAYTASLFMKTGVMEGLPGYLVSLLLGGIVALLIGVVIGIPGLRLKGDYLAIITLAFGQIIKTLIEYFNFTGGAQGLTGIPRYMDFTTIFVITVLAVVIMYSIMTSRHGRAVLAIREDEIASDAIGINTTYYKVFAFALSAMFAGIAGGMYAQNMGNITAKYFDYNNSINILVMVVLGGMGSFTGATISAVVLTILPEMLRTFADYRMIIYALVLIIMMIFRPTGLLGRKEFQITKVINFIKVKLKGKEDEGGKLNE